MRKVLGFLLFLASLPLAAQTPYLIKDINPGAAGSSAESFVAAGDLLYFKASDGSGLALWRTDGTAEGTIKLSDFAPSSIVAAGRSIFFTRANALWTSNGTPEGTGPATSFASRFPSTPSIRWAAGDTIFASISGSGLPTLWSASLASNAPAIPLGTREAFRFATLAGRTYFFPSEDIVPFWTSDGTAEGTWAVSAGLDDGPLETNPISMGGHLYFPAHSSGSPRLWKSEGTADGTVPIKDLPGLVDQLVATASDQKLFFNVGSELWWSDGTTTQGSSATIDNHVRFAVAGERAVFAHRDGVDLEPWATDGTPAGTFRLRDISPGSLGSFPREFLGAEGLVYFSATENTFTGLWSTDGTSEGTRLVANGLSPQNLVRAGQFLFFTATNAAAGTELWALPLPSNARLSIADLRVAEGDAGTSTARFAVTLSSPLSQSVTVEFATADGTAVAGSDYDAVSGTLAFAPGQTSRAIDVPVRGDAETENNETFSVRLRNAAGAGLSRASASAIVEDDDQLADLFVKLDFTSLGYAPEIRVGNRGPRTATNVNILRTSTPGWPVDCAHCQSFKQVAPAETRRVTTDPGISTGQGYITLTVTSREEDPQPADNKVGWIVNDKMAMDALYLTPGASANVWFRVFFSDPSVRLESSNPAVVSVPASIAAPSSDAPVHFVAQGVGVGTATIRATRSVAPFSVYGSLIVEVVAAGTNVRSPGALMLFRSADQLPFDSPAGVIVRTGGTAPYNGALASGVVTVSSAAGELARITLPQTAGETRILFYLPQAGANEVTVNYSGDSNFLPQTFTVTFTVLQGHATITATGEKTDANGVIHVRVTGSPAAVPSGTIDVTESGTTVASKIPLVAGAADVALSGLTPGLHTYVIAYSGDARYAAGSQGFRLGFTRHRAAHH